jgi:hypothetical protein
MQQITAKKTQSEIKVLAINTLYEYAQKYYEYEKNRLLPFVGLNIFKVDGSLKAKYDADKLSDKIQLSDGTFVDAHYWFYNSSYSFDIRVKICINGGSYDVHPTTAFCQYEEISLTLFKKDNDKLADTDTDISFLHKRYDVNELRQIAANIKLAAIEYEKEAGKMPYQFNSVFGLQRLTN